MRITKWNTDPFADFEEFFKRFPALHGGNMHGAFIPAVDVYETEDAVMVEAPLAGIDPENVSVHVENGVLTVQGKSKKEKEVDEKNYYRKEVRTGSFYRQVRLPVSVKEDKVTAEFADGVLKIQAPKASEPKKKPIEVKVIKKKKSNKK